MRSLGYYSDLSEDDHDRYLVVVQYRKCASVKVVTTKTSWSYAYPSSLFN